MLKMKSVKKKHLIKKPSEFESTKQTRDKSYALHRIQ
jgi:hypothetical protein